MASEPTFFLSEADREQLCEEFYRLLNADVDATLERVRGQRGTVVLNADDLFNMLPRYAGHPADRKFLGPILYATAKRFIDEVYTRLLAQPMGENDTVVFTAGGSATGKSTILRTEGQRPGVDFIVDTTFSDATRALAQVDQALASGRQVKIYYVYRDFLASLRGMLERAADPRLGRVVPVDDMARTHFGVQRTILAALEKYEDEPRVEIIQRINTSAGKLDPLSEREFFSRLYPSIDSLQKRGQNFLDELRRGQRSRRGDESEDHDAGRENLHFSESLYEAARSQAQAPKPPPGSVVA